MVRRTYGLAIAVLTMACGSSYKKLKVESITGVALTAGTKQAFCAYKPVALRAHVTYRNGSQASSRVPGERSKGRLRTSEFQWTTTQGTINGSAVLSLSHQTAVTWFHEPLRVAVKVAARPEFAGEVTLRPTFDCGGTLDYRSAVGARGGEAEHGGPGDPGHTVHIALAYVESAASGRLVLVRAQLGGEQPEHYLVDPSGTGPRFVIDARGGTGGRGGQGVAGLRGEQGAAGVDGQGCGNGGTGQDGTNGEPGGPGADGGGGGPGAVVLLHYDRRFPELVNAIDIRVGGGEPGGPGSGGDGGWPGHAGRGGKAGVPELAEAPAECSARAGESGRRGRQGARGPDGQPGVAGPRGRIESRPADVAELFAGEIEQRVPVVVGSTEGSES